MPKLKSRKDRSELNRITEYATLAKAFQLAHSLYRFQKRDRHIALIIVSEAINAVQVRLVAQHEADRQGPQKPTKVRWNTEQWLQLLIYCKSEVFERQQENDDRLFLSREDMIIRYVKHLILTTARRNSFHTCLGVTRLIYDYGASGTMAIYDMILQDPDTSTRKSDAYYRERKNKLLSELVKRFQPFVRIEQGLRGERRLELDGESNQFARLVSDYLTLFAPWDTTCKLPAHMDAWTTIHALQYNHPSQIHALIHPTCFARITKALKLDDPEARLALPRFFRDERGDPTPPNDLASSELSSDEAFEIRNTITEQRRNRKKFIPGSLSVLADGIETARLNLTESDRLRFDVGEEVNLIQFVGHNEKGDLLLASYIFTEEKIDGAVTRPRVYSITLEGGQKISLQLLPTHDAVNPANLSFELIYRETNTVRKIRLWLARVKDGLSEGDSRRKWLRSSVLDFRLLVAFLTLIAVVLTLYFVLRKRTGEDMARYEPPPSSIDPNKVPRATAPIEATPKIEVNPPTLSGTPRPSTRISRPKPGATTREQTIRATRSLLSIQRIFLNLVGDHPFNQSLQRALSDRLESANRFVVTAGTEEADTALEGSIQSGGRKLDKGTGRWIDVRRVTLQLRNVSGDIIWTRNYRGTAEEVSDRFVMDLLAGIESEKRRGKDR